MMVIRPRLMVYYVLIGLGSLLAFAPPTIAQNDDIIQQAEQALESIRSVQGRFIQIAPDGTVARGHYAVERPGRLRFEYDRSNDVIISDSVYIMKANMRTGNTQRRRLESTPLYVLLADDVQLEGDVTVISAENVGESKRITMYRTGHRDEGLLTLIFDASTYQLEAWQTVDANGERTTVRLNSMETVDQFPRGTFRPPIVD